MRFDGSVWTTDKDGPVMDLLAAVNIYKIYAESFRDQFHLGALVREAQGIVNNALR